MSRAGVIETILAANTAVKTGDVIVKIVGNKPIEAEITGLTRDEKRARDLIDAVQRRLAAAQAASNKAAEAAAQTELAERQKTVAAKQDQLAAKTAELDKFLVHAPSDGSFTPAAKPGAKVAAEAVVAKIQRDVTTSATFKVTDARPFTVKASIAVGVGKGEQRVTCTIAEVQPSSVKVTCPADPALVEGTDVTLALSGITPESPPGSAPAPAPGTEPAPGTAPAPTPGK
jgi:multidrug efflux pump subunit AcrA (membrane-fusion protein)